MPAEMKTLEEVSIGDKVIEAVTKSRQGGPDSEPAPCGGQERLHRGCRLWSDGRSQEAGAAAEPSGTGQVLVNLDWDWEREEAWRKVHGDLNATLEGLQYPVGLDC